MINKKDLLKNLRSYSPEQIASAVKNGTVSLYELAKETEGAFTPLLKKKVLMILESATTDPSNESVVKEAYMSIKSTVKEETEALDAHQPVVDDVFTGVIEESEHQTKLSERKRFDVDSQRYKDSISNKGMFRRPFSFRGRIRRLEYWLSIILFYLWYAIGTILLDVPEPGLGAVLFVVLPFMPMLWFNIAQGVKRCHDRGNSGWFILIPFYGLWMLFGGSQEEDNEYGDNPKE